MEQLDFTRFTQTVIMIISIEKGGERMVEERTAAETTNIILKLTQEGWDANKINEFIVFIETHKPSEDEAMNILKGKNTAK